MNSLGILSPRKIPSFLELKESSIPGAGLGIVATRLIKRDSYLGTYEGEELFIYYGEEYNEHHKIQ